MEKKTIRFPRPVMPKATDDSPQFIMQDLTTGKCEPADDLATALFGKHINPDEFKMEEIEGKEE